MAKPTINDIRLFLDDLLEKRKAPLLLLSAGIKLQKLFTGLRDALLAVPLTGSQTLPLAKELGDVDSSFDGDGRFLYYLYEAYQGLPNFDAELLAGLKAVRDRFIPNLEVLSRSYADESAWAKERQDELATFEKTLRQFPVAPVGSGRTLFDIAVDFIEQGKLLSRLLSDRATQLGIEDSKSRKDVSRILNTTIGLVGQCRAAIDIELKADPSTPQDLESQILGYYDRLLQQRATATKPTTDETKPEPTTVTD